MEQLITGGGYAQSNNMLLQNQMQFQHAMMARQTPPQIQQLTPGLSGGMGGLHFQTPTQGNAQRTLMNGGSTGFSFPSQKG